MIGGDIANDMAGVSLARLFHETYERLAPSFGYATRDASAVAWDHVPEPNRSLMIAVAHEVLGHIHVISESVIGQPRPFVLQRDVDVTGVSGVGVVAQGVRFTDGSVALRRLGDWPTSVVFHQRGVDSVLAVHGHDGRTRIVWGDK